MVRGSTESGHFVKVKESLSQGEHGDRALNAKTRKMRDVTPEASPLSEDQAIALLKAAELSAETIEQIFGSPSLMSSRKVRIAAVCHPKAPRRFSLAALRHFFTFDLMSTVLTPTTPADIKRAAEEILIAKLDSTAGGVRLSLARRGSGRIAAELLMDCERRIVTAALENPRLTEAMVAKVLGRADVSEKAVESVYRDPKWSVRREIRIALLRSPHTPMARAIEFAREMPRDVVSEILQESRLPKNVKVYLVKELRL